MKGDFSRLRFSPNKNYTCVLQQQGRVSLDADTNEQCAIDEYLRTTETVDVVGIVGGPRHDEGFKIAVVGNTIEIGKGRYYVDGIVCENKQLLPYSEQPFLINPNPTDQDLLNSLSSGSISAIQVYLQVWQRLVTALDDPCLREPALGLADTTTRLQTVWRVVAKGLTSAPTEPLAGTVALTNDSATVTGTGTSFTAALQVGQQVVFASDTGQTPYEISTIANDASLTLASNYAGATTASTTVSLVGAASRGCCNSMVTGLAPIKDPGKLNAQTSGGTGDCSCQPTPSAGYRGLENQLYRVEIHQAGDEASATFKWSRENGSVVVAVTGVSGSTVYVDSLGPDANLGFSPWQWVEISDDTFLFGQNPNQPGDLYQIKAVSPETLSVTMTQPVASVDPTKNARMRRWDQFGSSATSNGVSLSTGWLDLENGIQVEFSKGEYASGDYWLIPARTATGQIEWPPCNSDGHDFQPAHHIEIFNAPLACIQWDSQNQETASHDCRRKFPPLTDITACDVWYNPRNCPQLGAVTTVQQALDKLCQVQGPCTIVPTPGPGWEAPLLKLTKGADADICFPVGDFPLKKPVVLQNLGHLRISGGGPGTTIVASGVTAALIFSNCVSVQVSDLYVSTDRAQTRRVRSGGSAALMLGGTLSFADCSDVSVENVWLKCGYGEERTTACITVQNSITNLNQTAGAGHVRIRHCNLSVGRNQDGILLVEVQRAEVEDNILSGYLPKRDTLNQRLQDLVFRANAVRELIAEAQFVKAQPSATQTASLAQTLPGSTPTAPLAPEPGTPAGKVPAGGSVRPLKVVHLNATVTVGKHVISFRTHPLLKDFWQAYLSEKGPKEFATQRDLLLFIKKAASEFLLHPKLREGNSALVAAVASVERADQTAMARGIAVGGEGVQECRILNNSVQDAVQGITVGMSNHKRNPFKRDSASVVTIAGNQIYVGLPPGAQFHARHAIFVGNVESTVIENNYAKVLANPNQVTLEAIRVWGVFGRRLIVRHCHLAGFNTGILVDPLSQPEATPLWLVVDNMAENAAPVVWAPATVQQQNNFS